MVSPGWYPDPNGSGHPRWWDGEQWWPVAPPRQGTGLGVVLAIFVFVGLFVFILANWP